MNVSQNVLVLWAVFTSCHNIDSFHFLVVSFCFSLCKLPGTATQLGQCFALFKFKKKKHALHWSSEQHEKAEIQKFFNKMKHDRIFCHFSQLVRMHNTMIQVQLLGVTFEPTHPHSLPYYDWHTASNVIGHFVSDFLCKLHIVSKHQNG